MCETFIGLSREKCLSEEKNWKKRVNCVPWGRGGGGLGSVEKSDNEYFYKEDDDGGNTSHPIYFPNELWFKTSR